ncbi:MAG: hypothetical protein AB1330_03770 [Bacillota bacterium]
MKKISRRDFLKSLGGLAAVSDERKPVRSHTSPAATSHLRTPDVHHHQEIPTVCTGCDRGCGVLITAAGGEFVAFEGDPDHPASEGFLCEEGANLLSLGVRREAGGQEWTPELLYRPAGTGSWETGDWNRLLQVVAGRIKETRDASFEGGWTSGIGCLWDDALFTNEEGYLLFKLFRALGVVAFKNQGSYPGALSFRDWHKLFSLGEPAGSPAADRSLPAAWYGNVSAESNSWLGALSSREETRLLWSKDIKIRGLFIWGGDFLLKKSAEAITPLEDLAWLVLINWFKTKEMLAAELEQVAALFPRAEVFCLPAAAPWEKTGSVISAGRWVQWCTRAVDPRGQVRTPLWILDRLFKAVRDAYGDGGLFPEPILELRWDYDGDIVPDVKKVAAELNGYLPEEHRGGTVESRTRDFAAGLPLIAGYWREGAVPSMRRSLNCEEWSYVLPQ